MNPNFILRISLRCQHFRLYCRIFGLHCHKFKLNLCYCFRVAILQGRHFLVQVRVFLLKRIERGLYRLSLLSYDRYLISKRADGRTVDDELVEDGERFSKCHNA